MDRNQNIDLTRSENHSVANSVRNSAHSIDLSASEDNTFDTQHMLSIFLKKSNMSDMEIQSVHSNKTVLDDRDAFLELDSSSIAYTQGSRGGTSALDFKDLKWNFPAIEDGHLNSGSQDEPREIFLNDEIKIESRNGINCIETYGKHRLIYGDMDGNVAIINLKRAFQGSGKSTDSKILFRKLVKK